MKGRVMQYEESHVLESRLTAGARWELDPDDTYEDAAEALAEWRFRVSREKNIHTDRKVWRVRRLTSVTLAQALSEAPQSVR